MMRKALIVGEDVVAEAMVETRLWASGYSCVVHARNAGDGALLARLHRPSLVVLLARPAEGPPLGDAVRLAKIADAPILIATSSREAALACLGTEARLDGPYPLERIDEAVRDTDRAQASLAEAI